MPKPTAIILVHPGSLLTHSMPERFEDALQDFENHDGPRIVIDGFLSDGLGRYNLRIWSAMVEAVGRGDFAMRLWGCDSGEAPFPGWSGYGSEANGIPERFDGQVAAAAALASLLDNHDVVATGAWATADGSSGCVNSVIGALQEAGWRGDAKILDSALLEDDLEYGIAP